MKTNLLLHRPLAIVLATLLLLVAIPAATVFAASSGPNSAGTGTDVTFAGSDHSWSNPGNISASDDQRAEVTITSSANVSNYLEATNLGFDIPGDVTITGIQVAIERSAVCVVAGCTSNVTDSRIRIIKGGTVQSTDRSSGASWPTTDTAANYGGTSDLWGTTWTPADINAANFGVAIAVGRDKTSDKTARVDHVTITVTYKVTPTLSVTNSPVTYDGTSQIANVIASVGGTVSGIKYNGSSTAPTNAGTYAVTADFTPTDTANYNSLNDAAAGNFVIDKATQATLTAVITPPTVVYGSTAALSSTGGSGTGAVTFSEGASTGCSVTGNTLSVTDASGTCSITATKAADTNYFVATSAAETVTLQKAATTTIVTGGTFTYDGAAHAATVSVTGPGGLNLAPSPAYSGSCSAAPITVAQGTSCTASHTYAGDSNYLGSSDSASLTINKANATFSVTPYSVTYDGAAHTSTGSATGVGGDGALAGLDLSATTHTEAGTYNNDPWTFTDVTGNYNNANGTVDNVIAKANATINVTGYSVTYDGTAHTATGTATGVNSEDLSAGLNLNATTHTAAGVYASDPWTFTPPSPNYNNGGGTVSNSIAKANLTISGLSALDKDYDGNNTATLTGTATLVGVIGSDIVTLSGSPTALFVDPNVGLNKPVTVTGFTLSGADAGNYNLIQPTGLTANINGASVTVTGITASHKVYDGNTAATLNTSAAALVGVVSGDDVQLDTTSAAGAFVDKNVGTGKSVNVSGLTLTGADAGKYLLIQPTATADITARDLSVTAAGNNKVYDGTTAATVTLSSDAISGDVVNLSASAAFADANVGTGKAISVTGISLGGADAGNYNLLNTTANTSADITQAPLTVTANNRSKTIGQADPPFTFSYSGFVNGETSAVIDTPPTCGVSVPHASAGTYPIVCSGGADNNYSFSYVNGTLTVTSVATVTFSDVPDTYWAWSFIERLYAAGITGGCSLNPLMYCPEGTVTRAQMAVFLERGIHGASFVPPAVGSSTGFGDVPTDYWAATYIKQLVTDGITVGCGGGNYCPENPVTRAQMAVFLLRSKHGASYVPPAVGSGSGFGDVPLGYWAEAFIKQLVAEGITVGCGNGNYCPEDPVTRAQMAVFLVRTFGLP